MQLLVKQFEETQLKAKKLERHRSKTFAFADDRPKLGAQDLSPMPKGVLDPSGQLSSTISSHLGRWT